MSQMYPLNSKFVGFIEFCVNLELFLDEHVCH